ncbi:enoyl-CoA hydratase/isomerase [Methylocucumis oryzae]|uniref:Polyketide biosynthesis enoyl-CoA hydratase n=1 Tax=Methylocucumis oryzae TaxID=1632867 RepID=A0A0F3ILY5_9GAMM|nr:enoyl-CoA hydratase/isomerase [Methylocucumis oryzae]KJV07672.1 polyketide biosynthesis enoyl-CoA hydratase [Methylocucumis oryzae]
MSYQAIKLRLEPPVCYLQLHNPAQGNTINDQMLTECLQALAALSESAHIVVLEGMPDYFCLGADFSGLQTTNTPTQTPELYYSLLQQLASGDFVSIAHVKGKTNAGGVGLVAACDIVLADNSAEFSLSELLFDLYPACVLPFLIRRIGLQKAHYLTLSTKPINTELALAWGLVDASDANSASLLRIHLLRLRHLSKTGIANYKRYINQLYPALEHNRSTAINANRAMFANPETLNKIKRYVATGLLPWES